MVCLSVKMSRSVTAIDPCFPTAANRGLISFRLHQALKPEHQNCDPLSVIKCFGLAFA